VKVNHSSINDIVNSAICSHRQYNGHIDDNYSTNAYSVGRVWHEQMAIYIFQSLCNGFNISPSSGFSTD